ncbi:MAG: GNAT family N-acetyltransferase [Planctomycetaceae bacterium]|nr:GNAT family N-acetyltransferase [Planctomycetaceae bacterium]
MTLIDIEFQPFGATSLARYGTISASVEVRSIVRPCARDHPSGLALQEIELTEPYVKDYDALPENRPVAWSARLEPGCSVVLLAHGIDGLLGGAVVTLDPAAQFALHACKDAALLWDIRVAPDRRRHAVGSRLFEEAAQWAAAQGCSELLAETQHTNVVACRFYADRGCRLLVVDPTAYADVPLVAHETLLLWTLPLR